MQSRIPTHSEYHLGLHKQGASFLEKFQNGGTEKLVSKWLDYYFEIREEKQMSKEEFKDFLVAEIEFFILGYESPEKYLESETPVRLMGIYDRYILLLSDDPNSGESVSTIKKANAAIQNTLNTLNSSPKNGAVGYEAFHTGITEDKKEVFFENGVIPENKDDWEYYLANRYKEFNATFQELLISSEDDATFRELVEFAIHTTKDIYQAIYQGTPLIKVFSDEMTRLMYLAFMKNHVYDVDDSSDTQISNDTHTQEEVNHLLHGVTEK